VKIARDDVAGLETLSGSGTLDRPKIVCGLGKSRSLEKICGILVGVGNQGFRPENRYKPTLFGRR
jgi:hypothetical protein